MDLWFGDSWPIGCELGKLDDTFPRVLFPYARVGRDNPLKAFSTIVSENRNQQFVNFAKSGASIEYALYQLVKFCKKRNSFLKTSSEQLTAFLCLTAQIRGFGFEYVTGRDIHYVNEYQNRKSITPVYDSLIALNSFYAICKMHNINCVMIPIFCDLLIPDNLQNIVLFDDSLLTNTSLVELTFGNKLIDDALYDQEMHEADIYAHLASLDWISPNKMHPNEQGHIKLANKLSELLDSC
jgi:hypothetical protein